MLAETFWDAITLHRGGGATAVILQVSVRGTVRQATNVADNYAGNK